MKIEISRDGTGAQLAVVLAVSVGLGRAGSQGSAFLGRGLAARRGQQSTLCLAGVASPGTRPCSAHWGELRDQTQRPGQGKGTTVLPSPHIFLCGQSTQVNVAPMAIQSTCFVCFVYKCVRNKWPLSLCAPTFSVSISCCALIKPQFNLRVELQSDAACLHLCTQKRERAFAMTCSAVCL